jgi:hypothetical protein
MFPEDKSAADTAVVRLVATRPIAMIAAKILLHFIKVSFFHFIRENSPLKTTIKEAQKHDIQKMALFNFGTFC